MAVAPDGKLKILNPYTPPQGPFCPALSLVYILGIREHGPGRSELRPGAAMSQCIQGQCLWWRAARQQCAVVALADALDRSDGSYRDVKPPQAQEKTNGAD